MERTVQTAAEPAESKRGAEVIAAAVLRNMGPKSGGERSRLLLQEHGLMVKLLQDMSSYLSGEVQAGSMEFLDVQKSGGDLSKAYYNLFLDTFTKLPVTIWDASTWMTAVDTMEGLEGETFTYAMWKNVRPQVWAWNAQWPTTAWACRRVKVGKIRHVETRFCAVIPLTVGDSEEDLLATVAFVDVMLPVIKNSNFTTWRQLLPYISVRFLYVGEPIPEQSYYKLLYFLEQKVSLVQPVKHTSEELETLQANNLRADSLQEIVLRRLQRKESAEGSEKECQYQWVVSGHIRRQWYPSLKAHKMIFIEPYMKGDENKPMLPFKGTLYLAKR